MKPYKQSCYNFSTMYSPRSADNMDFKIEDYLRELYLQSHNKDCSIAETPEAGHRVEVNHEAEINREIQERFHIHFQIDHKLEESFIASGDDLLIARHLRYLPPFLHTHNFFEIACLVEGFCSHYINGQQQHLSQGDILIMAPGTIHAIHAADDDCLLINILIRLIQDYTGMSFSKNIRQIRLNHAAALLEGSELSVSEISEQVGYSNVSHFRKLFIERFSMPPQEYRTARRKW